MRFIILVSIVIFGAAIAFGSPLVSFFAKKGTPVYEIAREGFQIFPFSFLFCGLILVCLLILPEFMGVAGVWLAVPIAELFTMVVALVFFYQNKDRYYTDCFLVSTVGCTDV